MAATDSFLASVASLLSPAENLDAVTKDDANDLAYVTRGLYVGTSGDVKVTTKGGQTLIIPSLAAGVFHPLRVTRVWSTSTTATGIVAAW